MVSRTWMVFLLRATRAVYGDCRLGAEASRVVVHGMRSSSGRGRHYHPCA